MKRMLTYIFSLLFFIMVGCTNEAPAEHHKQETPVEKKDSATMQTKVASESMEEVQIKDTITAGEKVVPSEVIPTPAVKEEDRIREGHYSYFAEVGYFKDCSDGSNYLVSLRKETVKMESDYLRLMKTTNEPIFVRLKGRVKENAKEKTIIVDDYLGFSPDETCKE